MSDFSITVNGKTVPVIKGQTVLQASLAAGIDIPVFCWHPQLVPVGACRICLVEIEKFPKLQVACATPATDGMVVHTESPKVVKARQGVLEFILAHHPLDCPTCDKGGECDLQNITFKYGLDYSRLEEPKHRFIVDADSTFDDYRIGPEIIRNQNRCIHCYRCTRITDEVCFEDDLGAYQRGYHTEILPPPGREIRNLYSGNVVEYCPVGALTNTDWRYKVRVWLTKQANVVCSLCPDGCNLTLWSFHNKLFRATAHPNEKIDRGFICDVGRYGYQYVQSSDRLKTPMIKKGGQLVEASWEEALDFIKRHVSEHKTKLSGSGFFGLIGPTSSNEEVYSFQRFLRRVIGTNNIDHRLNRKRRLSLTTEINGKSIAPDVGTYDDLDQADTYVVYASDLHTENPITALRLKRGIRHRDARLITINARPTHLAVRTGAIQLMHKPGAGVLALLGLINGLLGQPGLDQASMGISDAAIAEFRKQHAALGLDKIAANAGLKPEDLEAAIAALAKSETTVILTGSDFGRYPFRDEELAALHDLRRVCKSAKLLVMPTDSNSVGAEWLGALPDRLPGKLGMDGKTKFEDLWRGPISDSVGKDTLAILDAINEDEIECGFVFNSDPARSFADGVYAKEVLEKLKTLIVIDSFMTDTARLADVLLPRTSFAEFEGTRTNWEGRVQYSQGAIKPTFQAKPGCEIIELLADALGNSFDQPHEADVYAEMRKILSNLPERFAQFTADGCLLRAESQIERAGLVPVEYHPVPADSEYPYYLAIENADHHRGTLTERSESLMRFANEPYVGISEGEAKALGISEGDLIKVESRTGKVVVKVRVIAGLPDKMVLVPENFDELKPNLLTGLKEKFDLVKIAEM
ncbi:MAG: NADH-quinone oxidoreductase subunit NuoG [candidate division Zixibacteria bacterium]|nr:NADH-quinone oxidoreductase subunit NuoG [candidate division Zixibacteria bacterium]